MNKLYWSIFSFVLFVAGLIWLEYRFANIYTSPITERLDKLSGQISKLNEDLNSIKTHVGYQPKLESDESEPTDKPSDPPTPNMTPPSADSPTELQNPHDQLYKFKVGTTWVFEQTVDDGNNKEISNATYTVIKSIDTTQIIINNPRFDGITFDISWAVDNGFLIWHYEASDAIKILKLNSRKGDKWIAISDSAAEATNMGRTILDTKAGQFVDVSLVSIKIDDNVTVEYYLVYGVGPVKIVIKSDSTTVTMLLKQFIKK